MNIQRLEKLAEAVRPGHCRFGDLNVAFSLSRYFTLTTDGKYIPKRSDLGDPLQYNATACMVGFTFLVTNQGPVLLKRPEDDFRNINMYIEARWLLGLDDNIAFELFNGCLDEQVTGEVAYRAIRGLLITGHVNWFDARRL